MIVCDRGLLTNRAAIANRGMEQISIDNLPIKVALRAPRQVGDNALGKLFGIVLAAGLMKYEAEVALDASARCDVFECGIEGSDVVDLRNPVARGDNPVHQ